MSFVSNTPATGLGSNPVAQGSAAGSATGGLNQLANSQTFLKLLVAQLKNQNPDNPTDPTAFMTEIAQLTSVESQTSLSAQEQTVAADSMIGYQVQGYDANGHAASGVVDGVVLSQSGPPQLQVTDSNGSVVDVALNSVTQVYQANQGGSGGVTSGTSAQSPTATSPSGSAGTSTGSTLA